MNPTRIPIEQKESVRWLENVKRATERLADPSLCVHIGDRESDIEAAQRAGLPGHLYEGGNLLELVRKLIV